MKSKIEFGINVNCRKSEKQEEELKFIELEVPVRDLQEEEETENLRKKLEMRKKIE